MFNIKASLRPRIFLYRRRLRPWPHSKHVCLFLLTFILSFFSFHLCRSFYIQYLLLYVMVQLNVSGSRERFIRSPDPPGERKSCGGVRGKGNSRFWLATVIKSIKINSHHTELPHHVPKLLLWLFLFEILTPEVAEVAFPAFKRERRRVPILRLQRWWFSKAMVDVREGSQTVWTLLGWCGLNRC